MGAPGSLGWLVGFDLRLGRRAFAAATGGRFSLRVALLIAGAFLAMLLMVRPLGRWIGETAADPAKAAALDGAMALGALIVLPWIASHALTGTTRALYGRGDLDLLFTSPLPPRRILAARTVAIFLEATMAVGVFLAPLIVSAVWFGGPRWLAMAPALAGVGMFGTALGVALALGLFALVGPRRTRQIAHVAAMMIGVTFVAALQALNFLPQEFDATLAGLAARTESAPMVVEGMLRIPAAAAQADVLALLLLLAAGGASLAGMCALLGRPFVHSALRVAGAPTQAIHAARWSRPVYSRSASSALRRKEWKLLARDPWLIGHLLMQAIYTLPIAVALWRLQPIGDAVVFILGPTMVIVMAQLSAALAWVAVSSEEAQDLMASAPMHDAEQQRRKLEAVASPLIALFAPVILWLAWISPLNALAMALFAGAAAASTALVNIWRPQPGKRSAMLRRYAQSKIVAIAELLIAILWSMAAILFLQERWAWMVLVGLALATLWLARPHKARESRLEKRALPH